MPSENAQGVKRRTAVGNRDAERLLVAFHEQRDGLEAAQPSMTDGICGELAREKARREEQIGIASQFPDLLDEPPRTGGSDRRRGKDRVSRRLDGVRHAPDLQSLVVFATLGCYPLSAREKRLAMNEALFREMNERVEERVQRAAVGATTFEILCECADLECTERITLTTAEYERSHADAALFTVIPGHTAVDVEEVVGRHDGFDVVRKRGLAGQIAEDLEAH